VEVWGEVDGGTALIHIKDNGLGFKDEFKERIFQPFTRLHGRGVFEGTGMGLPICRKIVEQHGGKITVQSQPGAGSTFTIELPLEQSK
jgi:signal transduction histidine kinase